MAPKHPLAEDAPEAALRIFPEPLPDESLFGLACRIHRRAATKSAKQTLAHLFGNPFAIPAASLPSHIGYFSRQIPPRTGGKPEEWVLRALTLFPYFNAFLTERQSIALSAGMISDDGRAIKGTIGILAGRIGAAEPIRFCRPCVADNFRVHGTPYWHRSHQLPRVAFCHVHGTRLDELPGPSGGQSRHKLFLPSLRHIELSGTCTADPCEFSAREIALAVSFSRWSHELLTYSDLQWSPTAIQSIYRARLIELGLAHANGRTRQKELLKAVLGMHEGLGYIGLPRLCQQGPDGLLPWLGKLVRKPRGVHHPVLHLLLLMTLFSDWRQFADYRERTVPGPEMHRTAGIERRLAAELPCLLVTEHKTLTAAARTVGCSITTVRVWAERMGIPVAGLRPKHLVPGRTAKILDALASGAPIDHIAKDSGVSAASVYRLLKMNPKVASVRNNWLLRITRRMRRQHLRKAALNNPRITSQGIRHALVADVAWLTRHDRKWLDAFLARLIVPMAVPRLRVNWDLRDRRLGEMIPAIVARIHSASGRPRRITKAEIGRHIGHLDWLEKKLVVLPRTRASLLTLVESNESFSIRKACWAAAELQRAGTRLSITGIIRLGGIRGDASQTTRKCIERLVRHLPGSRHQMANAA